MGSLLEISVKTDARSHCVSVEFDFDPALPHVPEKPYLFAECIVLREKGASFGAILRELLR